MKYYLILLFTLLSGLELQAQDDLLKELDSEKSDEKELETTAFKGLQICNIQSTKLPAQGEFYVLISHRFGDLTNGLDNFFGLDNALTKIGGIYGVANWLSLGASRHTYNKTYELAAKYKFVNQRIGGFPFTIVGYNTVDINSKLAKKDFPDLQFNNRLAFTSQLLLSSKLSNAISLQGTAIFVHKNLYEPSEEKKQQVALAAGGRVKLSKRISFNLEYAARLNPIENPNYVNPLTFGFDIETGGHVFQMVFSNSQQMNDVAIFTNTTGKWNDKGIYFGFNMYRVF
jgi:hypothetical protein